MSLLLRSYCALGVAGAIIASAGTTPALAQSLEQDLYVSVIDDRGSPVKDLQVSDFIVRENGVQREVLRVTPATAPIQVVVLVDNSQAAEREIPYLREGLHGFVKGLPGGTDISLVTVADRPTIVVDYTTNRNPVDQGIDRVFARPGSGAYTLDGLIEVSRGIEKREAARPVIVLITTEGPEFSELHYDYVLEALHRSGAGFHAVILTHTGAETMSDPARTRSIVLDRGTKASGGRHDILLTGQALPETLMALAAEMSNQYRVVYARPRTLIPPQKVDVEVTRPNLKARGTPARIPAEGK